MITRRKFTFKMFLITCLVGAGVLFSSWPLYAAKWTIRLGHGDPVEGRQHKASLEFKRIVEEDTRGLVEIRIYPTDTLGSQSEQVEGMQVGTHDMSVTIGRIIPIVPEVGVVDLPYLFENRTVFERLIHGSPIGDELLEMVKGRKIVSLGWWENGFRCVTNNVRPIRVPSDLKGIKLRTPPNPVRMKMFTVYGANPAPLSWSELFSALTQGVFDGQENPLTNIVGAKLYEAQKYLSLTKHVYNPQLLNISKKLWDELPTHVQASMKNAAEKVGYQDRAVGLELYKEALEFLSQHMEINEVDFEAFKEASKPVYEDFEYQELLQRVLKVVK